MDIIFYDGGCGLCHWSVKFAVRRDPGGRAFRFAPLGGATFLERVPADRRAGLPDSIVLLTGEGALLARSAAVLRMLRRLGGVWAVAGVIASLVPRVLRDAAYDFIARVRYKLFRRPQNACPLLPPELRARFDP